VAYRLATSRGTYYINSYKSIRKEEMDGGYESDRGLKQVLLRIDRWIEKYDNPPAKRKPQPRMIWKEAYPKLGTVVHIIFVSVPSATSTIGKNEISADIYFGTCKSLADPLPFEGFGRLPIKSIQYIH
jgi:hypothetical protein